MDLFNNLFYIDGLTTIETMLLYAGVGVIFYLCYLQYRSIRRRRRHRRHQARKRAHEEARRAHSI